ncbi:MAG: methyltransferase domain-containing protein [Gemmatimonadetes bacterium]|nr:methyltransferase domain-containing protein [Gemmatimonadota bacterium]
MRNLRFATVAVRDFKVGALTVSTKYVVRAVARALDQRHAFIVEYGAGDGILTKALLKKLPEGGRITAVERNDRFYRELRRIRDPRLRVIRGDVIAMSRDAGAFRLPIIHGVVSSIPLSFASSRQRETLVSNTWKALAPDGVFVVYQYTPLILPLLKKYFSRVTVGFEPRNILPYFIMRAEK